MYDTVDILVNYHEETESWQVTTQALYNKDNKNEQPRQIHDTKDFCEDDPKEAAIDYAYALAKHVVDINVARQATVIVQGTEKHYVTPKDN